MIDLKAAIDSANQAAFASMKAGEEIGRRESAAKIAELVAERDALLSALNKLTNEISGIMSLADVEIRHTVGNTNFGCLSMRVAEARAAIAKATA